MVDPTFQDLGHSHLGSVLGALFGYDTNSQRKANKKDIPKGFFMFGGVGCGKTMLMDMFYETLPANISSKSRTHFHDFMQGVHKRLHKIKMENSTDCDTLSLVAADIAVQSIVLCFDEFQCTDVADAMILRRQVSLFLVLHI